MQSNPFSSLLTAGEVPVAPDHWQARGAHGRPDPGIIGGSENRSQHKRATPGSVRAPGIHAGSLFLVRLCVVVLRCGAANVCRAGAIRGCRGADGSSRRSFRETARGACKRARSASRPTTCSPSATPNSAILRAANLVRAAPMRRLPGRARTLARPLRCGPGGDRAEAG